MRKYLWIIATLVAFAAISAVFQYSSPNIADPDGFYHLAHARFYGQNSFFDSSFPWTQFSVIKTYASDLWYGFHILLIPFSFLGAAGLKIASVFLTFAVLVGLWRLFKKLKVKWAALWPIFFFISAPNIMHRLLMLRPHNFSMALGALILLFFAAGAAWPIFIFGFLLAWIHLSL